jgi:hypothetical protein
MPNYVLLDTTPGRTHIGSWFYYFHGGRSMNLSLDLGMMTNHRLPEFIGQSLELSESTKGSSKTVTPNLYSPY